MTDMKTEILNKKINELAPCKINTGGDYAGSDIASSEVLYDGLLEVKFVRKGTMIVATDKIISISPNEKS